MKQSAGWIPVAVILLLSGTASRPAAGDRTPTPTPAPKGDVTLSDVAGEIKLDKKAVGGKEGIVISNENLADLAGKGRVTEVTKPGANSKTRGLANSQDSGVDGQAQKDAENVEKKHYWQGLYGQQLKLLQDIGKQIDVLDYNIPGLWRDFYSWDDPAYRDGVIKPKLDEALAQRQKLEGDQKKGEANLNEIKEKARHDGGEPGWFRGFDALPTPKPTVGVMPP